MHWRTIVQFHIRNKLLTTNLYWCNLDIFCGLLYYTTRMMTILTLYFWMKSDVVVYVHTINWYWWKFGILFENSSDQLWEKGCSSDQEKLLKIRGWSPRIWRYFETTKTIYSNSESSEEFFETELFSNLLLESSIHIKFIYSEKATNFRKISTVDLSLVTVKSMVEFPKIL